MNASRVHFASMPLAIALASARAFASVTVPTDYPTIQAAIDSGAQLILVEAGIYHEAITFDGGVIRAIDGPDSTTIDGGGAVATVTATWQLNAKLEGFTITGGQTGVVQLGGSVNESMLEDCVIRGNGQFGYVADDILGLRLSNCTFLDNGFDGVQFQLDNSLFPPFAHVDRCTFRDDGIQIQFGNLPGFATLDHCSVDGGSVTLNGGSLSVHSCILWNVAQPLSAPTSSAIYSDVQGGWPGFGNIDADPLWHDPSNADYFLLPGSPCIGAGAPGLPVGGFTDMGSVDYFNPVPLNPLVSESYVALVYPVSDLQSGSEVPFAVLMPPDVGHHIMVFLVVGASELAQPGLGGIIWPQFDLIVGPFLLTQIGPFAGPPFFSPIVPDQLPQHTTIWVQGIWMDLVNPDGWGPTNGYKFILT